MLLCQVLNTALGPLPLVKEAAEGGEGGAEEKPPALPTAIAATHQRPVVLPDGSYATQTAMQEVAMPLVPGPSTANLRCARVCVCV